MHERNATKKMVKIYTRGNGLPQYRTWLARELLCVGLLARLAIAARLIIVGTALPLFQAACIVSHFALGLNIPS